MLILPDPEVRFVQVGRNNAGIEGLLVVLKGPGTKTGLGGFKTYITHHRVLRISVNIPTKAFYPPMCILFVCSESCFYISTRRRWAGLAYKSDTGDPPFLVQNECDSSPFAHQSILMKDHSMRTAQIV